MASIWRRPITSWLRARAVTCIIMMELPFRVSLGASSSALLLLFLVQSSFVRALHGLQNPGERSTGRHQLCWLGNFHDLNRLRTIATVSSAVHTHLLPSSTPTMSLTSKEKLPYAADATLSLSASELGVLRQQYAAEEAKGWVSVQTSFNLAWGLVKSEGRGDVAEGIALLMGPSERSNLSSITMADFKARAWAEVYRQEPSRRRECLYYLSLGHYKLGNYAEAKRFNGASPTMSPYPFAC